MIGRKLNFRSNNSTVTKIILSRQHNILLWGVRGGGQFSGNSAVSYKLNIQAFDYKWHIIKCYGPKPKYILKVKCKSVYKKKISCIYANLITYLSNYVLINWPLCFLIQGLWSISSLYFSFKNMTFYSTLLFRNYTITTKCIWLCAVIRYN